MPPKVLYSVVGGVVVLCAALYFGSPVYALYSLASAAKEKDRDRLSYEVDFPSVRDSLKSQFSAAFAKKATTDTSLKDNPFAGLAVMMVPMLVDRMIDSLVTPDGLADLIQKPLSPSTGGNGSPNSALSGDLSYIDLDHFRAKYAEIGQPNNSFAFILERRGLISWKLVRIDLPLDYIFNKDDDKEPASQPEQAAPDTSSEPNTADTDTTPRPPDQTAAAGEDAPLPTRVGACAETSVKSVSTRLENTPGSGSAISYSNGGYQVSYDTVPGIDNSEVGDRVSLCLVELPTNCPAGDDRGKIYDATNLRTREEWKEPDSEHSCGGA